MALMIRTDKHKDRIQTLVLIGQTSIWWYRKLRKCR